MHVFKNCALVLNIGVICPSTFNAGVICPLIINVGVTCPLIFNAGVICPLKHLYAVLYSADGRLHQNIQQSEGGQFPSFEINFKVCISFIYSFFILILIDTILY